MRTAISLALTFSLLSLPSLGSECSPQTPIIKVDGRYVDCSYFNYVVSKIPEWVIRKYYGGDEGLKKLEDKMAERQLILEKYKKEGLLNRPDLKEKLIRAEIKNLSALYMSKKLSKVSVSEREIDEEIRKHYRSKKVTPELRRSIKVNLEVRKIVSEREKILNGIKSKLQIKNTSPKSLNDVVAVFDGRRITYDDIKPLLPRKFSKRELERALTPYAIYLEAKEEGLDKLPEYRNSILYMKENLAVSDFERRLLSKIHVSDDEIKNYYRKHREEFKTPESARVMIVEFDSEREAKEALKKLKSGKTLKDAVPKKYLSTAREWTVLSSDKENPVSQFVFSTRKKYNLLNVSSGKTLLIITEKRKPSEILPLGDVYNEIKEMLKEKRAKKEKDKIVSALKKKYGLKILRPASCCRD